tara:strand:- start:242 stop:1063 length:822 start_codon:yes stop_codon:yes gene_type:complete
LILGVRDEESSLPPYHLRRAIEVCAYTYPFDGESALAAFLRVERNCLRRWISGKTKPALESAQRVFGGLGVPWAEILMNRVDIRDAIETSKKNNPEMRQSEVVRRLGVDEREDRNRGKRISKGVFSRNQIMKFLDRIIAGEGEPCSRAKLAESLGVSVGYLEFSFDDKVRRISEIYQAYRAEQSDVRTKWLREAVYSSLQNLYENGEAPSCNNVSARLSTDIKRRFTKTEIAMVRKAGIPEVFSGRFKEEKIVKLREKLALKQSNETGPSLEA